MRIIDRTVFIGANVYARYPVIRLRIDLGPLEEWPSRRLGERFIGPLLAALPGLATHGCSYGTPGGFVRRLREDEGTWMGHILEHVALELQHLTGATATFGKTRSLERPGEYYLVYAYEQEAVGVRAGEVAERLLRSILPAELHGGAPDPGFDLTEEIAALVRLAAAPHGAGPPTGPGERRIVIVAGDAASETARHLGALLSAAGHRVGIADELGAGGERDVLAERHDAYVLATTRALLIDSGLGTTRCDVGAVFGPLDGERDAMRLPLEIARRGVRFADAVTPAAAAGTIVSLLDEGEVSGTR
jgi:hypothetical protein